MHENRPGTYSINMNIRVEDTRDFQQNMEISYMPSALPVKLTMFNPNFVTLLPSYV
jgi:hypothetical protein